MPARWVKGNAENHPRIHLAGVLGFFVLGLVLFLASLSHICDLNGVSEAEFVEASGLALFNPNHLFYCPVG